MIKSTKKFSITNYPSFLSYRTSCSIQLGFFLNISFYAKVFISLMKPVKYLSVLYWSWSSSIRLSFWSLAIISSLSFSSPEKYLPKLAMMSLDDNFFLASDNLFYFSGNLIYMSSDWILICFAYYLTINYRFSKKSYPSDFI